VIEVLKGKAHIYRHDLESLFSSSYGLSSEEEIRLCRRQANSEIGIREHTTR
jgi:hypothetical protein